MNPIEKRATLSLACIFGFRMLGLFMILPVFALYANQLPHATPMLIGLALGIYGLTQACLQIPFGMLSDFLGRKRIITLGLVIFAIGSLVAAMSQDIHGIIIGRALQGAGAIGSSLMALVADLTDDNNRSKAMAMVGMVIGSSFMLAMLIGPLLNNWIGISGIFWFTALLALTGIAILHSLVPTPKHTKPQIRNKSLSKIIRNPQLMQLNFGIFTLHAILTAIFIVVPTLLTETMSGLIYLPILVGSFLLMLPLMIIAERRGYIKQVSLFAIALLFTALLTLATLHQQLWQIALGLLLFFTAFSLLEAVLPSQVSKTAPTTLKGTALGVYSTSQFLGIFIGGSAGGWIYGHSSINGVFYACAIMAIIWLSLFLISSIGTANNRQLVGEENG